MTITRHGRTHTEEVKFDNNGVGHFKGGVHVSSPAASTTWQTPQITTAIQPAVVGQSSTAVPVSYTPTRIERTAIAGNSWGFASASIGISSYGNYYPMTYWEVDNRYNELARYRYFERGYGRGWSGGYPGHRLITGESYNSGVRPMPPVGPRPPMNHR